MREKRTYQVEVPVKVWVSYPVEATNKKDAIQTLQEEVGIFMPGFSAPETIDVFYWSQASAVEQPHD